MDDRNRKAKMLEGILSLNRSSKKKCEEYKYDGRSKKAAKAKPEDDPDGFYLIKTEVDQKMLMYLGVSPFVIQRDFPIGSKVPNALLIALRARRARVKAANVGEDVPSGTV